MILIFRDKNCEKLPFFCFTPKILNGFFTQAFFRNSKVRFRLRNPKSKNKRPDRIRETAKLYEKQKNFMIFPRFIIN